MRHDQCANDVSEGFATCCLRDEDGWLVGEDVGGDLILALAELIKAE